MFGGFQKTITFLLLIGIGVLLKYKISSKEQLSGVKAIILSVALPATIFIALLKIDISPHLLLLPILALAANFLMFGGAKLFTKLTQSNKSPSNHRTLLLLIPSFAPGLSCFPFLIEYLGEESLALAALADIGNKIFGLIILYLIAMTWYYKMSNKSQEVNTSNKYKSLFISLVKEPINIVIVTGVMMLCLGFNFMSLPTFGQDTIQRLSATMTPLVLLFIGIAVKVGKKDVVSILQILFWRSGFAFLMSAILLMFLPTEISIMTLLLAIVFPQSSCSFWPFAHMSAVNKLNQGNSNQLFDLDLAVNILAFSLPFSTMIILTICSTGSFFANPIVLLIFGISFIGVSLVPVLVKIFTNQNERTGEDILTADGLVN